MVEWSDLELRREAMVIVQVLELELEGGQKQLFLRTKDLISKVPRKVADKVVSSLQSFETNQRASYC